MFVESLGLENQFVYRCSSSCIVIFFLYDRKFKWEKKFLDYTTCLKYFATNSRLAFRCVMLIGNFEILSVEIMMIEDLDRFEVGSRTTIKRMEYESTVWEYVHRFPFQ